MSIRPCIKFSQIALSQTAAQQLRFPQLRFLEITVPRICSDFKLQYLNGQVHEIADPPTLRFLEYRFLRLLLLMCAAPVQASPPQRYRNFFEGASTRWCKYPTRRCPRRARVQTNSELIGDEGVCRPLRELGVVGPRTSPEGNNVIWRVRCSIVSRGAPRHGRRDGDCCLAASYIH